MKHNFNEPSDELREAFNDLYNQPITQPTQNGKTPLHGHIGNGIIVEDAWQPSPPVKAFSFEALIRRAEIHSRRYQTVGQFRKGGKRR